MRKPAFSKAERHSRQKQVTRQRQKLLVSFSWDQPTFKNLSVYWMQMGIRVQTGVQSLEVLPNLSPCALDLSGTRCSQPRWDRDCRLRGRWGRAAQRTRWAPRGCLCPPAAGASSVRLSTPGLLCTRQAICLPPRGPISETRR